MNDYTPDKICSVPDCGRIARAHGVCDAHYRRLRRHGDVQSHIPLRDTPRLGGCEIAQCDRAHYARGLCVAHYNRLMRLGGTNEKRKIEPHYSTPAEAFFGRIAPQTNGCVLWTGPLNRHGYGSIELGGRKRMLAHRYAWEQSHGTIPEKRFIDHICHNRACVNVEHLRIATPHQNQSNRSGPSKNNRTSGARNVVRVGSRWRVYIGCHGTHYCGSYATLDEARRVAQQERFKYFGSFAGRA